MLAPGCTGEDPPEQNEDGCEGDWFTDYVGDTDPVGGDLSCWGGTLENTAMDSAKMTDIVLNGQSVDHQSSDPHPNISVDLFYGDDHNATADLNFTTDGAGRSADGLTVPACQAVSYIATRDGGDEAPAPPTLLQHKVWDIDEDPLNYDFRSVSEGTVNLVTGPVFYSLEIEAGKGMMFGRAFDCIFESVVNAQIVIRDADCKISTEALVGYTTNELPDPYARATTADGFYFGINIPAGDWFVDMYGQNADGGFDLLGSAPATVEPDTVTLVDVAIGRSDGLVVPMACR